MRAAHWSFGVMVTVTLAAAGSNASTGQYQQDPSLPFLRMLNTIQSEARPGNYHRSLPELLASPSLDWFRTQLSTTAEGITLISGMRRVMYVVSADRRTYQIALVPTERCGPSLFTNETGRIYYGLPLGCQ